MSALCSGSPNVFARTADALHPRNSPPVAPAAPAAPPPRPPRCFPSPRVRLLQSRMYVGLCGVSLVVTGLFHSDRCSPTLHHVTRRPSFVGLNNIPLDVHAVFSLSIRPSVGVWVASTCIYPF